MARRRNHARPNSTGRNQTSRFARLDHRLLTSNAYRALSPNARSLLVELTMLDNGANNGSLYLSVRDGAHRMGVADLTAASRAFDDLMALGFVEMTQEAHFRVKASETSRARCWRLTWLPGPDRKAPSWEMLTREPEPKTPARRRMERGLKALKAYGRARDRGRLPVLETDTMTAMGGVLQAVAVAKSNTSNAENGGFAPKCRIRDSATHIAIPWGKGSLSGHLGWWQPDWTLPLTALAYAASLTSNSRALAA